MRSIHKTKRRAIIIGGSMSGLFAAAFLRKIGWDADVYERSRVELVGRGAGITTHPELIEALEASGAGTADLGIEVEKRIALDRNGKVTGERPLRQILTSWDRLQRLLRATIDEKQYHLGHAFERVDQDEHGVRVTFAGGKVEHADLLIGGDGIRSSVRAQLAPELQPIPRGQDLTQGPLASDAPLTVDREALRHLEAEVFGPGTACLERVHQFGMRGDAGAAAFELDRRALVDIDLPADLAQERGAEQARHRAADDDCAFAFSQHGRPDPHRIGEESKRV